MKRILWFLLMAVMAFCVAACGASADTAPETPEKNAKTVSEPKIKGPVAESSKDALGKNSRGVFFPHGG